MNVEQGLIRISVVLWSLVGAFFGIVLATGLFSGSENDRAVMAAIGVPGIVAAFIGHKATKWIIGGFFTPKR